MPQLSVTVTGDELREIQQSAGTATVSNYVRGRLGLPALARGRAGRQNDEVTRRASEDRAKAGTEVLRSQSETLIRQGLPVIHPRMRGVNVNLDSIDRTAPPIFDDVEDEAHELAYEPADD